MIITALDIATATGVTFGAMGKTPTLTTWNLRDGGPSRPERLGHLFYLLKHHIAEALPSAVVYEAPVPLAFLMKMGASEETIAMLRGAIGVVEACCASYAVPVEGVLAPRARRSVLGWYTNRTGKGTKKMVVAGVRALGLDPKNDNEADAYVLWQYKCNTLNPRLAHLQQPLFKGR